jgi:hypothetical protein
MANRLVQGTFGSPGNFEVVILDGEPTPKLIHGQRDNSDQMLWQPQSVGAESQKDIISASATSSGALIQSSYGTPDHPGNFEVLVLEGTNLVHYYRDNSASGSPWHRAEVVSTKATGPASFIQSSYQETPDAPGNFEAVVLEGNNLVHYYRNNSVSNPQHWQSTAVITSQAAGPGCIIQSDFGTPGNFEVVVREKEGLVHYYRDNSNDERRWYGPTAVISPQATGDGCIIQSTFGASAGHGNFEVVVIEVLDVEHEQGDLVHYYRDNSTQPYHWYRTAVVSTAAQRAGSLIQSSYGTPGNFEVVLVEGAQGAHGLSHRWRDNSTGQHIWKDGGLAFSYPFDSGTFD